MANLDFNSATMTADEFLIWVDTQTIRHDLIDGVPRPHWANEDEMFADATAEHDLITQNVYSILKSKLKGSPCDPIGSGLAVSIFKANRKDKKIRRKDKVVFPDGSVDCGFKDRPAGVRSTIKPVMVVEVLSPSTRNYDLGDKRLMYETVLTIQHILYVEQDKPVVMLHSRGPEGVWIIRLFSGLSKDIELNALQFSISMAEIYENVKFPDA